MSFPASGVIPQDAFANLRRQQVETKRYLTAQKAIFQQPVSFATAALGVIQYFANVIPQINTWAATPGLAVYAQAQMVNPTLDIVAEFNTMMAAMTSAQNQLIAMFPKDANGFLLYQQFNADGTFNIRTFTSADLAPVVALIDSVNATIG